MDPNETLKNIRNVLRQHDMHPTEEDFDLLAESFRALDGWLLSGGFLPESWKGAA